jgi:ABC-type Fe3+-hydroxamate transport system substrate-binding protein
MKTKIISLTIATLVAIVLSACGGGGSSFSNSQNIIAIDVNCTAIATISSYIPLERGDTITVSSGTPTIITYHDVNGTKRVCLDPSTSGSANIIRQ